MKATNQPSSQISIQSKQPIKATRETAVLNQTKLKATPLSQSNRKPIRQNQNATIQNHGKL